jgi:hypothetical protein
LHENEFSFLNVNLVVARNRQPISVVQQVLRTSER